MNQGAIMQKYFAAVVLSAVLLLPSSGCGALVDQWNRQHGLPTRAEEEESRREAAEAREERETTRRERRECREKKKVESQEWRERQSPECLACAVRCSGAYLACKGRCRRNDECIGECWVAEGECDEGCGCSSSQPRYTDCSREVY